MYQVKNRIFLDFDKTQKTALCNYLRALTKQNLTLSIEKILNKFLEDEKYYLEINASRFPYIEECIENIEFINDVRIYLKECKKYYEYKEQQRPIIEANKEFERKKRKFLQEVKMSKEAPTQKQIYYYDKLCKKYSIDKKNVDDLSKLDIKNEIERILKEHETNYSIID